MGVWGLAVPVLSDTDVICAVGIAGPSPRLTVERVRRDVRLVHEAALAIGRALGLTSPPVVASEVRIGPAASAGHGASIAARTGPGRKRRKR